MMNRIEQAPVDDYDQHVDVPLPGDDLPPLDASASTHDMGDLPPPGDFDMPMPDDFGDMGGGKSASDHFNDGLSAFAAQRFDEALSSYQQALDAAGTADPAMHEKILFELGRTHVKKGDGKGAVEKFSELLRTHQHGTYTKKTMIQLAEIYERARDTARAVQFRVPRLRRDAEGGGWCHRRHAEHRPPGADGGRRGGRGGDLGGRRRAGDRLRAAPPSADYTASPRLSHTRRPVPRCRWRSHPC